MVEIKFHGRIWECSLFFPHNSHSVGEFISLFKKLALCPIRLTPNPFPFVLCLHWSWTQDKGSCDHYVSMDVENWVIAMQIKGITKRANFTIDCNFNLVVPCIFYVNIHHKVKDYVIFHATTFNHNLKSSIYDWSIAQT